MTLDGKLYVEPPALSVCLVGIGIGIGIFIFQRQYKVIRKQKIASKMLPYCQ